MLKPQLKAQLERDKMMAYMQELRGKADVKVMLPEEKAEEKKPEEKAADTPKEEKK